MPELYRRKKGVQGYCLPIICLCNNESGWDGNPNKKPAGGGNRLRARQNRLVARMSKANTILGRPAQTSKAGQ
jgi:hypothetical protein